MLGVGVDECEIECGGECGGSGYKVVDLWGRYRGISGTSHGICYEMPRPTADELVIASRSIPLGEFLCGFFRLKVISMRHGGLWR